MHMHAVYPGASTGVNMRCMQASMHVPHLCIMWRLMIHACTSYRHALRRKLGSTGHALGTAEAVQRIVDVAGAEGSSAADREAACWALGSALAESPDAVFPLLMAALGPLLDRAEHEALSAAQIKIFQTPPGPQSIRCALCRGHLILCRSRILSTHHRPMCCRSDSAGGGHPRPWL